MLPCSQKSCFSWARSILALTSNPLHPTFFDADIDQNWLSNFLKTSKQCSTPNKTCCLVVPTRRRTAMPRAWRQMCSQWGRGQEKLRPMGPTNITNYAAGNTLNPKCDWWHLRNFHYGFPHTQILPDLVGPKVSQSCVGFFSSLLETWNQGKSENKECVQWQPPASAKGMGQNS